MASNFLPAVAQARRFAGFFGLFDFGEGSVRFQKPSLVVAGHAVQGEIVAGSFAAAWRASRVRRKCGAGRRRVLALGAAIPQSKAAVVQNKVVRIGEM